MRSATSNAPIGKMSIKPLLAMFQNSSHIRVDNSNFTNVQGDQYNIQYNVAGCG